MANPTEADDNWEEFSVAVELDEDQEDEVDYEATARAGY